MVALEKEEVETTKEVEYFSQNEGLRKIDINDIRKKKALVKKQASGGSAFDKIKANPKEFGIAGLFLLLGLTWICIWLMTGLDPISWLMTLS